MTTEVPTVIKLPMGSDVPEWLLMVLPNNSQANPGKFRFAHDVEVIDTPDYYLIVPLVVGDFGYLFDTGGMINCGVWAAGKMVRIIERQTHLYPVGTSPPVGGPVQRTPIPQLRQEPIIAPVGYGPGPNLWRWLRDFFSFAG